MLVLHHSRGMNRNRVDNKDTLSQDRLCPSFTFRDVKEPRDKVILTIYLFALLRSMEDHIQVCLANRVRTASLAPAVHRSGAQGI